MMLFYPANRPVPGSLRSHELLLLPLSTAQVELDYEALMESKDMLRLWSQSAWPRDDFTLDENLEDLRQHEQEHLRRVAFTYTVLDRTGQRCLGCVYIHPLPEEVLKSVAPSPLTSGQERFAAFVRFWVRQSRLADGLDRRLLAGLRGWFEKDWPFDHVFFRTSVVYNHQQTLLADMGLSLKHRMTDPSRSAVWLFYG